MKETQRRPRTLKQGSPTLPGSGPGWKDTGKAVSTLGTGQACGPTQLDAGRSGNDTRRILGTLRCSRKDLLLQNVYTEALGWLPTLGSDPPQDRP